MRPHGSEANGAGSLLSGSHWPSRSRPDLRGLILKRRHWQIFLINNDISQLTALRIEKGARPFVEARIVRHGGLALYMQEGLASLARWCECVRIPISLTEKCDD
jgi:hypothetical protein